VTKPTAENNAKPREDDPRDGGHLSHLDPPEDDIILTAADLDAYGLTPGDMRSWPGATECDALDGSPCWRDVAPGWRPAA
jgi:hypothetical protein